MGLLHVGETSIVLAAGWGGLEHLWRVETWAPQCGLDSFFQPAITRFIIVQTPQRATTKGNRIDVIPEKSLLAAPVRIT